MLDAIHGPTTAEIFFSRVVLHFSFLLRVKIPCSFQDRLINVKVFTKMRKKMSKLQVSPSLSIEGDFPRTKIHRPRVFVLSVDLKIDLNKQAYR